VIDGPVLALDSSTALGSVAAGDAAGVRAEVVRSVAGGHSSALLPMVERVMEDAGLRPADLAAVVVGGGPGSFTGLRVAAATAKGMVRALGVPLLAYSGLLAAAASAWAAEGEVCALFDARRRDVFAACYRFGEGVEERLAPTALDVDAVVARFRGGAPPVFVGDGALLHREQLERELGARVLPAHLGAPRAASLVWLAAADPERGGVRDAAAWEPEYVRASGAERIAARSGEGGR
jgi:tRNA threonylcarbamoyladenosine biosynthesis protein TsaB